MPDPRRSRYLVAVTFQVSVPSWDGAPTPTTEAAEAAALAVCGGPCEISHVEVQIAPVGTKATLPRVPRLYRKARRTR